MQHRPLILGFVLLLLAALAAPAQTAAQGLLQPEDVANLATVSDPQLSPDGRRVVYLQKVPRDPEEDRGPGASRLLLVSLSGGDPIPSTYLRRVDLESGEIESIVEGGPVYMRAHLDADASAAYSQRPTFTTKGEEH